MGGTSEAPLLFCLASLGAARLTHTLEYLLLMAPFSSLVKSASVDPDSEAPASAGPTCLTPSPGPWNRYLLVLCTHGPGWSRTPRAVSSKQAPSLGWPLRVHTHVLKFLTPCALSGCVSLDCRLQQARQSPRLPRTPAPQICHDIYSTTSA